MIKTLIELIQKSQKKTKKEQLLDFVEQYKVSWIIRLTLPSVQRGDINEGVLLKQVMACDNSISMKAYEQ